MLLVTGGAGFIGSNIVASLNEAGRFDIAVNDILGSGQKWRNLAGRQLAEFVPAADLTRWLEGRKLDAVVHMGAISSTTATDVDELMENNFRLSLRLFDWCAVTRTPFIYASSAATYGDGGAGFGDDGSFAALKRLKPLNPYGWSKHLFDLAVVERVTRRDKVPPQWAGLKFFNVFGPNEYHKGEMMSLVPSASRRPRPAGRSGCSNRTARALPTASRSETSFMWTTRWRWCAGCWRRRKYRVSSMSAPGGRRASAS
jgi:ADP-L-glycero-D-manno-heptose 6-epimerase